MSGPVAKYSIHDRVPGTSSVPVFSLSIAGYQLRFRCETAKLFEEISAVFPRGMDVRNEPDIVMDVFSSVGLKPLESGTAFTLLDGAGEYHGWYSRMARRGSCVLTSSSIPDAFAHLALTLVRGLAVSKGDAVLHAAAVEEGDGAFLFSGPSGAGKSTICSWAGSRRVIGDDLILLRKTEDGLRVWGLPASKTFHDHPSGAGWAVQAIFQIVQSTVLKIGRNQKSVAMAGLAAWPQDLLQSSTLSRTMDLLQELVNSVPCYRMEFPHNDTCWDLIPRYGKGKDVL